MRVAHRISAAVVLVVSCSRGDDVASVRAASAVANGPSAARARLSEPAAVTPVAPSEEPRGPALAEAPNPPMAAPARLVAIGDLHGDLAATRTVLKLAGAIDDADHWAGGALVLVQTGDQIDRGDDDRAVLELFARLADEAPRSGGSVISLSGNHELMNVLHDFRYVTPASNAPFGGEAGRRALFAPGGEFARMLAARPVVAQIGATLFVHGGVLAGHVRYGLARLNREAAAFMRGETPELSAVLAAADAPVWSRAYSMDPGPEACAEARRVLDALGAKRMVVGHTVQALGINAACDGAVWRIDAGLSKVYGGAAQALEIRGDTLSVLR